MRLESQKGTRPHETHQHCGTLIKLTSTQIAGRRWQIAMCFKQQSQKSRFRSSDRIMDVVIYICASWYACEWILRVHETFLEGCKKNWYYWLLLGEKIKRLQVRSRRETSLSPYPGDWGEGKGVRCYRKTTVTELGRIEVSKIRTKATRKTKKSLYIVKNQIHSWQVFAGLSVGRTSKGRNRFLGCESSQRPGEPVFQPENVGLWNKNKTNHTRFKITERAWYHLRRPHSDVSWKTLKGKPRNFLQSVTFNSFYHLDQKRPHQAKCEASKYGHKTVKGEWVGSHLQGQQVAEWLNDGAANLRQSSFGHSGKNVVKELCCFFSLLYFFFQNYHFNQSFDNYETCQLMVKIHQMCHKWQEMRTWILKLDGLQKSLTITAIHHPGASVLGWRRLCRQQKCETKAHAEKGCHTPVAKDGSLLSGLSLELQRLGVSYADSMERDTTCHRHRSENT